MTGPQWTLAVFGAGREELIRDAGDRLAGKVRAVAVPDNPPGYGITGDTLVLIRPDGYIGLISAPGELAEVMTYLN